MTDNNCARIHESMLHLQERIGVRFVTANALSSFADHLTLAMQQMLKYRGQWLPQRLPSNSSPAIMTRCVLH